MSDIAKFRKIKAFFETRPCVWETGELITALGGALHGIIIDIANRSRQSSGHIGAIGGVAIRGPFEFEKTGTTVEEIILAGRRPVYLNGHHVMYPGSILVTSTRMSAANPGARIHDVARIDGAAADSTLFTGPPDGYPEAVMRNSLTSDGLAALCAYETGVHFKAHCAAVYSTRAAAAGEIMSMIDMVAYQHGIRTSYPGGELVAANIHNWELIGGGAVDRATAKAEEAGPVVWSDPSGAPLYAPGLA